jgi:uncharacterized protein YndB with AHSA1/START domain
VKEVNKKSVLRELRFPQSRDEVWRALTSREALADWMYPNDFEPRIGHRFTFEVPPKPEMQFDGLTVHCEVLRCDPPQELAFSWVAGGIDTVVEYRLAVDGQGTKVYFEHSGFDVGAAYHGASYGWEYMHGNLTAVLEGNSTEGGSK